MFAVHLLLYFIFVPAPALLTRPRHTRHQHTDTRSQRRQLSRRKICVKRHVDTCRGRLHTVQASCWIYLLPPPLKLGHQLVCVLLYIIVSDFAGFSFFSGPYSPLCYIRHSYTLYYTLFFSYFLYKTLIIHISSQLYLTLASSVLSC